MARHRSVFIAIIAATLAVTGCSSRPESGALTVNTVESPGSTEHTVLIASTRERDSRPGTLYDGERNHGVDYAIATVSVPPSHVNGQIEWPAQGQANPAKDFVTRRANYLNGQAGFNAALKEELLKRPKGRRDIVLFVHGYNTLFAEGLYRFVELTHDAKGSAVPVMFTWASRGAVTDYVYDLNSATAARDGLEATLRMLAASGADHVNIVAHSMGNWVTVETLRQIRIGGHDTVEPRLGFVALAAPDIDVDVFKSQMRRYGKPRKPFIALISRDDRALAISSRIAGNKERVGDYSNDKELSDLGVIVVNLSALDSTDSANHWKFAQIDAYPPELQSILQQSGISLPAAARDGNGTVVEKFGTSLGSFVSSASNVLITLPASMIGQ